MTPLDVLREKMREKGCVPVWYAGTDDKGKRPLCSYTCPSYTDAMCLLTDDDDDPCWPMIEAIVDLSEETQ